MICQTITPRASQEGPARRQVTDALRWAGIYPAALTMFDAAGRSRRGRHGGPSRSPHRRRRARRRGRRDVSGEFIGLDGARARAPGRGRGRRGRRARPGHRGHRLVLDAGDDRAHAGRGRRGRRRRDRHPAVLPEADGRRGHGALPRRRTFVPDPGDGLQQPRQLGRAAARGGPSRRALRGRVRARREEHVPDGPPGARGARRDRRGLPRLLRQLHGAARGLGRRAPTAGSAAS